MSRSSRKRDGGDEQLTEDSGRGEGFLADLVADWEAATDPARSEGTRVVNVRTGIVQSPRGGMLRLLRVPFQAGLGGSIGDGKAWTSWIGIDDVADIYLRAVVDAWRGREGARELALAGQRVLPARLVAAGHRFRHAGVEAALGHLLGRADTAGL